MRIPIPFTEKCIVCEKSHTIEDEFIQCIENNIDNIDWKWLATYQKLPQSFIDKYQDKLDWTCVSKYQYLSEKFIEKFQDKVNWYGVSGFHQLSEEFIERHQNKVNWTWISVRQELSESFIEKFQDKVVWRLIVKYQNFSKEFIEEVLVKLNNPTSQTKSYIEKYVEEINNRIEIAIERNKCRQEYKKHIMTILQEDKLNLTEEFKNELFVRILNSI